MKDGIIKADGTSRLVRSVPDFKSRYPSYDVFAAAMAAETIPMDILFNGSGWSQLPDFLNKENLLKDSTAALYGRDQTAVPDDIFAYLAGTKNIRNLVIERIYSSQEWVAPKAANQEFDVIAVGGGGAGGGASGGGGGSGYITRKTVVVPDGTAVSIVCGAGAATNAEARGGTTSFGDLVTALGGFSADTSGNGGDGEAGGGGSLTGGNGGNGGKYGGGGGGGRGGEASGGGKGGNGGKYGGGGGASQYAPNEIGIGGEFGGNGGGAVDESSSSTAIPPENGTPWVGPQFDTLYVLGLSLQNFSGLAGASGYYGRGGGGGGGHGGNGGAADNAGGGGGGYGGNGGVGRNPGGGGGCWGGNGGDADSNGGGGGGGFFCKGGAGGYSGGGGGFFSDGGTPAGGNGGVMLIYFKEETE